MDSPLPMPSPSDPSQPVAPDDTAPASTTPANATPASTAPASTAPASTAPASTTPANTTSPLDRRAGKVERRSAKRQARDQKRDGRANKSDDRSSVPQDPGASRAAGRKRSSTRTRVLLLGIVCAIALVGAAIGIAYRGTVSTATASNQEATSGGEIAAGKPGGSQPAQTTTTQIPDVLPNPGVGTGECKMVTYTPPSAKAKHQGELCRPVSGQRDVAVVLVHGGAGVGGTYAGMKPWSNRLNTEGYVTFAVEYHLFNEGSAGPIFPLPEQNIKASVQFLRGTANALGIRNNQIAVQGFSAGARLAAVAHTTPNDQYFVGNELWPYIPDEVNALVAFYHPLDGSMQYQYQYYGGDDNSSDPKVKQRLDKADSLSNAADAKGPAAIITGENDWSIQITQGSEFIQTLQDNGREGAMLVVPGGGHGFDEGDGRNLSKLGEKSATGVLLFLNKAFPQSPERQAQDNPPDVVNAPNSTGSPPTSYVYTPRPRPSTPTTRPGTRPSTTPTTQRYVPPSRPYVPPTSVKPTVTPKPTVAPTTPPPTSNPPTSALPGQ